MEWISRIILSVVLLSLIYTFYKIIGKNKQDATSRDSEDNLIEITDHCDRDGGKHCKNTCQTINATKMKPG